jgi:hypothetical protein
VADICHRAKLDDYEWPLKARELLSHLQARWRDGIENGLSTEAAENRAIELFGSPRIVSKGMRKHWLKRLLLNQNCRMYRYVIFLAASVVGTYLVSAALWVIKTKEPDYPYQLSTFTNGFLALGALFAIKWQPTAGPSWLRTLFLARHVFWFLVFSGLINVVLNPIIALALWFKVNSYAAGLFFCAVPTFAGLLGAVCFVSEILNLSGRRKAKVEELIAFSVIK